jgi:hypothetical protein
VGRDDVVTDVDEGLRWRVHPAAERPVALACALGVIAVFGWLANEWMESWVWGLFAAGLMIGLLSRFFFPSEYQVDAEGVAARHGLTRQRLRWGQIRRFAHDARGGYVSPRSRPTALDAFRGVHLLFDRNGSAVVERIECELAKRPGAAELGTAATTTGSGREGDSA